MRNEARLGWALTLPALAAIATVAVFPILWTAWESLYFHDLRMPWLGRPFIGMANYVEAVSSERFWRAMAHTAVFTAATVTLELAGGLVLALIVDRFSRGRDLVRTAVLLPWAIPTVSTCVAAVQTGAAGASFFGSPVTRSRIGLRSGHVPGSCRVNATDTTP